MTLLTRRLNQTVYVRPFAGETDGDATYGIPAGYPCHIDYDTNRTLNARGEEVTSIATVYLEAEVSIRDKFILPDVTTPPHMAGGFEFDGVTSDLTPDELEKISRTPIKVRRITNPRKGGMFHHCEVML